MPPHALILTGYGINSEEETAYAFENAGAETRIVHINDLIDGLETLEKYQILAFPGGFAYGDDTGAGKAYANRVKNHLMDKVLKFVEKDHLLIGICNGCQIISNLGLIPAINGNYEDQRIVFNRNAQARFSDRWTDMEIQNTSQWLKGIQYLSAPIDHGEGNFYTDPKTLETIKQNNQIALKYIKGQTASFQDLPANPNGSLEDIAGITDESGRVLGIMPHPERALFFVNRPDWTYLKEKYLREGKNIPDKGPGTQVFKNAIEYFR